jgi:Zn-dependent protease with chaperone function
MVGSVFGFCIVWIPYWLLKKAPKRWWLYVGLGTVPFMFLIMLVEPIWVEPLFNDFGPMKNKALEAKVLTLADRAGIERSHVFEVNKSVDTKELNAYVTGFLGTKRIVIWDNTIAKMTEGELLFVLGHEMGHYVLGHVWKEIVFSSLMMLLTLFLADRAAKVIIARYKERFGFDRLSDIASFPLILLLFGVFGFIINPLDNWISRAIEHQADQFGLEITRDNHDAATAFVKLQMENLSNPRPALWYKILRADHPVLGDRIDYANTYKPWEKGEKPEFEKYFKR